MAANPTKFQTMLAKSNSILDSELNVTADNVSVSPSYTMKVLGIDIDTMLIFDGLRLKLGYKGRKTAEGTSTAEGFPWSG